MTLSLWNRDTEPGYRITCTACLPTDREQPRPWEQPKTPEQLSAYKQPNRKGKTGHHQHYRSSSRNRARRNRTPRERARDSE